MRSIRAILLVLAHGLLSAAAAAGAMEEVRLLSASGDEILVEVALPAPEVRTDPFHPGYHTVRLGSIPAQGEPGDPGLPQVSFWVACPPDGEPIAEAEGFDPEVWDGVRPLPIPRAEWETPEGDEPPAYRERRTESEAYRSSLPIPAGLAAVGPVSPLRYLRIAPVTVTPAIYEPAAGRLTVYRRIEVRVRFSRAPLRAPVRPLAADDAVWDRTYQAMVVNPGQAASWLRAPVRERIRPAARTTTDLIKIEVERSGLRRVEFADLAGAGWTISGVPLADLRLFERFHDTGDAAEPPESEVETPVSVYDGDASGTWTDGDAFFFYAQNLFDRLPDAPEYIRRYGRLHVYWLGLQPGAANARMEAAPSWLARNDLAPVSEYPWTERFEEEREAYMKMGALRDDEYVIREGVTSVKTKHVYWNGGEAFDPDNSLNWYKVDFDLPGYRSPRWLAARFQGLRTTGRDHRVELYLSRGDLPDTLKLPRAPLAMANQDSGLYVALAQDLSGLPISAVGNRFIHLCRAGSYGAALHWLAVSYNREPSFVDGIIQIDTAAETGPTEYRITRAPADELIGVDFSNPQAPKRLSIDPEVQVEGTGPGRRLRLQWELAGASRRFCVSAYESIPKPERFVLPGGSDLLAAGNPDFIVILPAAWRASMQPWVEHREAQGHRVLLASIEDVFDQFSGGRRWPHAIRSFLRALFRSQTPAPSFLLLVGDASDVFDSPLRSEADGGAISAPNWVPTQTMFSESYTGQGPELISSDQWFVDNLTGTGERLNFLPDMHVGRIPAGSPAELDRIVAKILAYESYGPDDRWRNRALFVSDDVWSSAITFDQSYVPHPGSEYIFAEAARRSIDVIANQGPRCEFAVDTFFVGQQMDCVPSLGRCAEECDPLVGRCPRYNPSADWITNFTYGGRDVRDRLISNMSRGHLFVSYVGHANTRLMSHEYVFRHNPIAGRADVGLLGNTGRPFLFMGYGCHLAEYSGFDEALINRQDGIAENLLFYDYEGDDNRGGIGVIASTGYEWIYTSDRYNLAVIRALFKNPPVFEGHTRWVLGEIVSRSKIDIKGQGPNSDTFLSMSATHALLGDPGLRIDAAPPRIAATLDGVPVNGGEALVLPADQESIRFEARVCDEVWARSVEFRDVAGVSPPDSFVQDPGDDRSFRVVYTTTVFPRDYDLVMAADDGAGRTTALTFPVRVVSAYEIRKPGQDWALLDEGERVFESDSVRVRLTLPRFVGAEDLDFLIDETPVAFRADPVAPTGNRSRDWVLRLQEDLPKGRASTLGVRIAQPDGFDYRRTRMVTTEARNEILELYNVPNPFQDETWFFYLLGAPAERVEIRIYSTSGKLIRTLRNLPSRQIASDPPARWDGLDEDGDPVANGLYFYKLNVQGADWSQSRIEKVARAR